VPENQTAAIKGISAIQQNHVRLNGGKQAAYKNPLQIAASHGQSFMMFFMALLIANQTVNGSTNNGLGSRRSHVHGWKAVTPSHLLSFRATSRNL